MTTRSPAHRLAGRTRTLLAVALLANTVGVACSAGELAESTSGERGGAEPTACDHPDTELSPAKALTRCLMPSVAYVETSSGSGSAMVVERDREQYLLTNLHVVAPESTARVVLPGDEPEELDDVEVVGVDKLTDIALLGPVETDRLPVRLEDPGVEKGDEVFLIGYPGETEEEPEPTITSGIVSRRRTNSTFELDYVQTDASISGGQSGGALADADGDVVGVSGLGFADEFALAIAAPDVEDAIGRILDEGGDEYWTYPPSDDRAPATSGSARLADSYSAAFFYLPADPAGVQLDLRVSSDAAPATITVDDYDTGENIFVDRAGVAALAGLGPDASEEEIASAISDFELTVGDPVDPGHWVVAVPPDTPASVSLGVVEDRPSQLTWTASPGVHTYADRVVDQRLELGEPVDGELDLLEGSATYTVELEADTTYQVSVASNENDPELTIAAPGETTTAGWLAADSGGIYGYDVDEEFTAEVSGPHTVVVENYGGASMVYRLEIVETGGD
jgi:hypothetical protein